MAVSAANGTAGSMWATRRDEPSATTWGGKESGAAFRGMASRGRGRGGGRTRAGGRGGRAFPDRELSDRNELSRRSAKSERPLATSAFQPSGLKQSGASDSVASPEKTPLKRVEPSTLETRRPGHGTNNIAPAMNAPGESSALRLSTLKAPPTSQSVSSTTSSSSSKSSSRRRRSNGSRKNSTASKTAKPLSSISPVPPVPALPLSSSKDEPSKASDGVEPVTPATDIRQDVESLVEHVRAMAMEGNRPTSPATHIDWAGDDDDSLPDLDDWGVSSKKVSEVGEEAEKSDEPALASSGPALSILDSDKVEKQSSPSPVASATNQPTTLSVSDIPSNAAPPVSPITRQRGERRRERGRGKDKEKKAAAAAQSSTGGQQVSAGVTPKKSLLERLSSPVRPDPLTVPNRLEKSPTRSSNISGEARTPSTLPHHPSLPPKPLVSPLSETPARKTNGTANLPARPMASWRTSKQDDVAKKDDANPASTVPTSGAPLGTQSNEEPTTEPIMEKDLSENPVGTKVSKLEEALFATSSFDWSEEPTPYDQAPLPSNVKLDVEPPTPLEEIASSTPLKADFGGSNAYTRSQRPLSGDITPRALRERSPHKTHNARNHSAPSPGGQGGMRTRAPHATRPIIRMDALAMISRSLRESPTPPRRESPAPVVAGSTD